MIDDRVIFKYQLKKNKDKFIFNGRKSFLVGFPLIFLGCSLFVTRPIQEMSDTVAAIQAAREVQSDQFAPDLLRQANEFFSKAKQEYRLKNFYAATEYSIKARKFAEQAEFKALKNGGNRSLDELIDPDLEMAKSACSLKELHSQGAEKKPSYDYPVPGGIPADVYEQRRAEESQRKFELEKIKAQHPPTIEAPPFNNNIFSNPPRLKSQ